LDGGLSTLGNEEEAGPSSMMVPVGTLFKVFYTDPESLSGHQDVHFISESGNMHSVNRCVLACHSQVCRQVLRSVYACPIANADENIYVSTNLSDDELTKIVKFVTGGFLPTLPGDGQTIDLTASSFFRAIGIDLQHLPVKPILTKSESNDVFSQPNDVTSQANIPHDHPPDIDIKSEKIHEYYDDDVECNVEFTEDFMEEEDQPIRRKRKRKAPAVNYDEEEEDEPLVEKPKVKRKSAKKEDTTAKPKKIVRPGEAKDWYFHFPQDEERDLSNPYQCQRCTRSFKSLPEYRQHFLRHNMEVPDFERAYTCLRCFNFTAGKEAAVQNHGKSECPVKAHYDDDSCFTYFCVFCPDGGQSFGRLNDWSRHMTKEHPEEDNKLFHSFVCAACGKGWRALHTLAKHKMQEGPHHTDACAQCGFKVKSWAHHQQHLAKEHGGVFKWQCGLCGVCVFDTEEENRNHRKLCKILGSTGQVKKLSDPNKTSCPLCNEAVGVDVHSIRSHLINYHADKQLMCKFCDQVFFEEPNLRVHMSKVHTGERYNCDQCEKDFSSKYLLKCHKIRQHASKDKMPFQCEKCDLRFLYRGEVTQHMKNKHGPKEESTCGAKKKMCEICGIPFTLSGFTKHMQRMHGTDSIKCTLCDKEFLHERILKIHMRTIHTYVTCEECGQQVKHNFYRFHKLKHHTPDALKPFVCKVCTKGFINKQVFGEHMNIHTGERPFKCDFCTKTFTNSGNKRKHIRESHRDEEAAKKAAAVIK